MTNTRYKRRDGTGVSTEAHLLQKPGRPAFSPGGQTTRPGLGSKGVRQEQPPPGRHPLRDPNACK